MSRNPDAPKAPKVKFLDEMVDKLDDLINKGGELAFIHGDADVNENLENLGEATTVDIREALDWLATMLGNRRDYHKRRQIKQKREYELLREALAKRNVDVDALEKEAEKAADESLLE